MRHSRINEKEEGRKPNYVLYNLLSLLILMSLVRAQELAESQMETLAQLGTPEEVQEQARMAWWREARFGMFIHWGLYAIPAGEWKGETNHAEWIRTTAQIPIDEYDKFVQEFNPIKFDADEWVRMAKDAGMKYIVITSKHHDGFSLFNSRYTDFDIMSTPFKRDIMDELANACRKYGLKICWYHSIMDWHHPDYLPRRGWESRTTDGADFDRYISHMKKQLKELIQNYGDIGVLWFDGEWEETWNHEYGQDLYDYVRNLQPSIIINNRVDAGRAGMQGLTKEGNYAGDFGTPEQEIPPTGLPGIDWETCMTMNDHWGYNKHNNNWKSSKDLIQKLADIVSKGGNFLLNVGPTAEGLFPQASIDRLAAMGQWMKINGESIYGTQASPFKHLSWGRCTQKTVKGGTRLYLHVFSWPENGRLVIPGIYNQPGQAFLLSDPTIKLNAFRKEDAIVINIPQKVPDSINSVVAIDIVGKLDVNDPPVISAEYDIFIDEMDVSIVSPRENITIRYTLDGNTPDTKSTIVNGPIRLTKTAQVSARLFRNGTPVSGSIQAKYTKVVPRPGVDLQDIAQGLQYGYYEGSWDQLPDFNKLDVVATGVIKNFDITPRNQNDYFGFQFEGFVLLPKDGVYSFFTDSDDGSRLYIGGTLLVENDGLHGTNEEAGSIALSAGYHPIRVTYFEKTGANQLKISYKGPNIKKQVISDRILVRKNKR